MTPLRIALLAETFPKRSETFISNQGAALKLLGHSVHIFTHGRDVFEDSQSDPTYTWTPHQRTDLVRKSSPALRRILPAIRNLLTNVFSGNFRILYLLNPWRYGKGAITLKIICDHFHPELTGKFDLVIAHFGPMGVLAEIHQKAGKIQGHLVTFFHGYDMTQSVVARHGTSYQTLFNVCHLLVANSDFTRSKLESLGAPYSKIHIVPAGLTMFEIPKKTLRDSSESFRIIIVARLVPVKGIDYALRIMSELIRNRGCNVSLKIVGDGPLMQDLHQLAEALEISDQVHFTGSLPPTKVFDHLLTSDLFLYTGIRTKDGAEETQGLAIQEAQATGIPVVAWASGGVGEGIIDAETGFVVQPHDINTTLNCIEQLMQSPSLAREMGEKAQIFARKNYDSITLAKALLAAACK